MSRPAVHIYDLVQLRSVVTMDFLHPGMIAIEEWAVGCRWVIPCMFIAAKKLASCPFFPKTGR
jgi:hypothetical protein